MPAPLVHRPPTADAVHASMVVALEAGDLAGKEQAQAVRLVEECPACAELLADLAAIRLATATLPAAPRTRDFRLTEADARRLSPTPWRSFLRWLVAPGSSVRPLAGGLATLGIVGLLLTSSPTLFLAGSAAAPPPTGGGAPALAPAKGADESGVPVVSGQPAPVPSMAAAPAPTVVPGATPAAAEASSAPSPGGFVAAPSAPANDRNGGVGTGSTASGEGAGAGAPPGLAPVPSRGPAEGSPDRTIPFVISLALLGLGALLLAGRIIARRATGR